jgi:hypothetical protein
LRKTYGKNNFFFKEFNAITFDPKKVLYLLRSG